MIFALPFRWIAPFLGQRMEESADVAPAAIEIRDRISWAVRLISYYAPWRNKCLAEAIAAKGMMRRRGISSTLYLGLAKDGGELAAHAWLRCGGKIVTGEDESVDFAVVAKFA